MLNVILWKFYKALLNIKKGNSVLELGCGTGFLTQKLVKKQAIVTSIDQSSGMITRARKRVPLGKFVQSDILQYQAAEKFDYVVLFFVLHELRPDDRITILKSAKRFLSENENQHLLLSF